jgi:omega-amidase
MRVAAIQHDIAWCDRQANFAHLAPLIAGAASAGARLVLLSETFSTGFATDREDLGEPQGGPSSQFLAEQAQLHDLWVAGSCPEIAPDAPSDDQRPHNTLVLVAPDGTQHRYRKIHPFTYGGETKHFRAGDQFVTVDVEGLRVSLFVCYDLRFADEFWGLAPDTDCYVIPANWPAARREHWMALLQARAIENQAYVVGVNRVGQGGKLAYSGDSMIIDPFGEIVAQAGDGETTLTADIDPARVAQVRAEYPFLQDRR